MIAKITHAFRYVNGRESTVLKIYKVINGELVKVWPMTKLAKFDAADLLGVSVDALTVNRNSHKLYLPANIVLSQKASLALADAGFTVIDAHNGSMVKLESSLADADRETISGVIGANASLVYDLAPLDKLGNYVMPTGTVWIYPIAAGIDGGAAQNVVPACADTTAQLMESLDSEAEQNMSVVVRNTAAQAGVEKPETEKVPSMLVHGSYKAMETIQTEEEQIAPFLVDVSRISASITQADNQLLIPFLQSASLKNANGSDITTAPAFPMLILAEPYFPAGAPAETEQFSELMIHAESASMTGQLIESSRNHLPLLVALCEVDMGSGEGTAAKIYLSAPLMAEPSSGGAAEVIGESTWAILILAGANYADADSIGGHWMPGFLTEGAPLSVGILKDEATALLSVGQDISSTLGGAVAQEQQKLTAFPVVVAPAYLFGASNAHDSITTFTHWTVPATVWTGSVESTHVIFSLGHRATPTSSGTHMAESIRGNVPLAMVEAHPDSGAADDAEFVLTAIIGEHLQPLTVGSTREEITNLLCSITNTVAKPAQGHDYESTKTIAGQTCVQLDRAGSTLTNGDGMQALIVDSSASTTDAQHEAFVDTAAVTIQAKTDLAAPKSMGQRQVVPMAVAAAPYFYLIGTHGEHTSIFSGTVHAEYSFIPGQNIQCSQASPLAVVVSTHRLMKTQDTSLDAVSAGAVQIKWKLVDSYDFQIRVPIPFMSQGTTELAGSSSWHSNQMIPLAIQAAMGHVDATTLRQVVISGQGQQIEASQSRTDVIASKSPFGLYLKVDPFTMRVNSADNSLLQALLHHIALRLVQAQNNDGSFNTVGLYAYGQYRLGGGYGTSSGEMSALVAQGLLDLIDSQGEMQSIVAGAMAGTEYDTAYPAGQQAGNLFVATSVTMPDDAPIFCWDIASTLGASARLEFEQHGIFGSRLQTVVGGCAKTKWGFADALEREHQIATGGQVSTELGSSPAINIESGSVTTGLCDVRYAPYIEICDIDTAHMSTLDILPISEIDTLQVQLLEPTKEDWRRYKIPNYIYS